MSHAFQAGVEHVILARSMPEPVQTCQLLQVAETLAAIQERHTEVMQLEKQLMDLHQIFLDMGVLVESQGELLNNIEAQVLPCSAVVGHHLRSGLAA